MIPVYPDVIAREPLTATDMAFLFAGPFGHLQDIQYAVVFYAQKHHKLPVGFVELVQVVEHDKPDVSREFLKDGGVSAKADFRFGVSTHPIAWTGYQPSKRRAVVANKVVCPF